MRVFILGMMFVVPIPTFAQIWVARYNGPANSTDEAQAIAKVGEYRKTRKLISIK